MANNGDGTIKIKTSLDTAEFKRQISSMGSIASKGIGGLTKVIAGASAALVGVGGIAMKMGMDFEAGMSRVKAISGATEEEFAKLNAQAKQLGADTAFSASEAAAGMENLASAGFNASETMEAMPGLLDLAAVSGGDVAGAADVAASSLRAFGLEADQAGHVADVFARAAADTNAEANDMGEAMKYVAPIAHSMGLSIEESAAAIGIMSDAGIKGSQAGTSLRGALSRLAKPTKAMRGTMDELGLSFYNAEGQMLPLKDQVSMLKNSFVGLSDEQKQNALVTLYGQESLSGMMALIEAGPEKLDAVTASLINSDGAAKELAETMQDNLKGKIEGLSGSLETLGITVYESMDDNVTKAVEIVDGYVAQIQEAFDKDGFSGIAESIGDVLADGVMQIADAAPTMIESGAKLINAFIKGLVKNKGKITNAAKKVVDALGNGIASIFPKKTANTIKTLTTMLTSIIKPAMTVTTTVLKLADTLSFAIAPALGLAAGMKAMSSAQKASDLLKKLTSVISNKAAVEKVSTVTTRTYEAATRQWVTVTKTSTTMVEANTVAQRLNAVASSAATSATKALSAAFAANPIGVVITGVTLLSSVLLPLIDKMYKSTTALSDEAKAANASAASIKKLTKELEDNAKMRDESFTDASIDVEGIEHLKTRFEELNAVEGKSIEQKAEMAAIVDELNEKFPELELRYDTEQDKLSKTTDEIHKYIAAAEQQMYADAARANATAALESEITAQRELTKAKQEQTAALDNLKVKEEEIKQLESEIAEAQRSDNYAGADALHKQLTTATQEYDKQKEAVDKLSGAVSGLEDQYNSAHSDVEYYQNIGANIEVIKEAEKSLGTLPDEVRMAIDESSGSVKMSVEDIANLCQETFNGLVGVAGLSGLNAMDALQAGMNEGKIGPSQAIEEAKALIKFEDLYSTMDASGKKAMEALRKSIEEGKQLPSQVLEEATKLVPAGIEKASPEVEKSGGNISTIVATGAKNELDIFHPIGHDIVSGVAKGIDSNSPLAESAIKRVVQKTKIAAQQEADIHSPSKLFNKEVGLFIGKGVAVGITDATHAVQQSAAALIQNTKNSMQASLAKGNFRGVGETFVLKFSSSLESKADNASKKLEVKLNNRLASVQANADAEVAAAQASADAQIAAYEEACEKELEMAEAVGADRATVAAIRKRHSKTLKELRETTQAEVKAIKNRTSDEVKAIKEANKAIQDAYDSAYQKEVSKLEAQAEKKIKKISDKYQQEYDALISKRTELRNKLKSVSLMVTEGDELSIQSPRAVNQGNLTRSLEKNIKDLKKYKTNLAALKKKIPDDLMAEILKLSVPDANKMMSKLAAMDSKAFNDYIKKWKTEQSEIQKLQDTYSTKETRLTNLKDDVKALKAYQADIKKLKGKIPQTLMDEILGMDTASATVYMGELGKMSKKDLAEYIKVWNQKEKLAKDISNNVFKDDIASLKKGYEKEINTQFAALKKSMASVGKNVAKGFVSGLKSEKASMSKVVKDICDQVIKDTKKKFGIKSPSRVFRKIGKQNIQGETKGLTDETPNLLKAADKTSSSLIDRFRAADIDAPTMRAKFDAVYQASVSTVPSIAASVAAREDEDYDTRPIILRADITADIDGKKVSKATARYQDVDLGKIKKMKGR
jgi:TP901 family phage tail tape measure protein